MSSQERGSALLVMIMVTLSMILHCQVAEAADYTVDWKISGGTLQKLTRAKKLKAGDNLVFNYQVGKHNVMAVNRNGYDNCAAVPSNGKVYTGGSSDKVPLARGANYFICTFAGHCEAGMKFKVSV